MDGFIEVWDYVTGKLKSLPFQDEDKFMMHESAVISLGYTKDGEHLVSGAQARAPSPCLRAAHRVR